MALKVKETTETSLRAARARWLRDCRMEVAIRGFAPLAADEPPHHGGSDEGPTPLEYVTAGLAACQAVTIAKLAEAMRFRFTSLAVAAETEVGWKPSERGAGPIPRFQDVRLVVDMVSDEATARLARLQDLVEERCPASTLFRDAGLVPAVVWNVTPSSA